MAGLRLGYAVGHVDTIKKMREWDGGSGTSSLNVLALHAGISAIEQDASFITAERTRNTAARDFTMKWFADRGMKPTDSQANFMLVNIGRPAKEFRDACRAKGVLVARDFTMKWFADRGMKPTDSQANFMFVNIGRPAKEFRDACRAKGVLVARDFPPFEKTHCRLSFGTMDEMKKAVAVFGDVLGKKVATAA
jgi:histidinol-phosphate/aromatic aminotransferase/cobyric acid decarboxylase-like protein